MNEKNEPSQIGLPPGTKIGKYQIVERIGMGGQAIVPGISGDIKVDIAEGSQTGTVIRVSGQGLPRLGKRGRGDHYVVIRVVTPTNLSREEKELLTHFESLRQKSGGGRHGKDRRG